MKIYISVDIEGVAGVAVAQQTAPGNPDYENARRLMTEEVNAAVSSAFEAGVKEVLVNDAHGPMINIHADLLDPRAELIRGNLKPVAMFSGLDTTFAGVVCLGFHAGAGDFGVLAHTITGNFTEVRLDSVKVSEAEVYGAFAGALGVPIIMGSGDDITETTFRRLFGESVFVKVKEALGTRAARSLSPIEARKRISAGVKDAIRRLDVARPYVVKVPCLFEIDARSPALADACSMIPNTERNGGRTVTYVAPTIEDGLNWLSVCSMISKYIYE